MSRFDVKIADGKVEVEPTPLMELSGAPTGQIKFTLPRGYIGKKVIVCVWANGYDREQVEGKTQKEIKNDQA